MLRSEKKDFRFFCVEVTQADEEKDISVKVPISFMRLLAKMISSLPTKIRELIEEGLKKEGVEWDLSKIDASNVQSFVDDLLQLEINVEHSNQKVKVYCS